LSLNVVFGIEHFQQRGRRVAAEILPELVDFVEENDGVHDFRASHRLDDPPRHRADVGPAVSANLRFVTHAAERHADEFPAERPRDRAAEGSLADAGRADEAEDLSVQAANQ
jgi:hypothetical protein